MLQIICCGRPCFEGLLQHNIVQIYFLLVVEDLVLKGYYNSFVIIIIVCFVVEDLVLKGYYNCSVSYNIFCKLWKTLF